jgi:RimJ/RimL family protein N-acetyltransferase
LDEGSLIEGSGLRLRELADGDIALVRTWLAQEHVAPWFAPPGEWIDEITRRHEAYSFIRHWIVLQGEAPVGFCQYYACKDADEAEYRMFPREGSYSIDYLIGEKDCLGKGLGTRIVRQLARRIFALPGAQLIVAQPDRENAASRNTLAAAGFVLDEASQVFVLRRDRAEGR